MIYYFLHDDKGEVLVKESHTVPPTEGMAVYSATKVEGSEADFYRAQSDFCYVDIEAGTVVFPEPAPSETHYFDYEAKQWAADLADLQAAKWEEVKAARSAEERSSFTWGGFTFQCDQDSQMRIQAAVQAAMLDDSISLVWTLADNGRHTFAASEMKQIGQALSSHVSQCHERGRILRDQIDAATTEEDLEAIVW